MCVKSPASISGYGDELSTGAGLLLFVVGKWPLLCVTYALHALSWDACTQPPPPHTHTHTHTCTSGLTVNTSAVPGDCWEFLGGLETLATSPAMNVPECSCEEPNYRFLFVYFVLSSNSAHKHTHTHTQTGENCNRAGKKRTPQAPLPTPAAIAQLRRQTPKTRSDKATQHGCS